MADSLVTSYAEITKAVAELIDRHAENDRERAAYLIARAAFLQIVAYAGPLRAGQIAQDMAFEFLAPAGGA